MNNLSRKLVSIIENYLEDPDVTPYKRLRRSTLDLLYDYIFEHSNSPHRHLKEWDDILISIRRGRLSNTRLKKEVSTFINNLVNFLHD